VKKRNACKILVQRKETIKQDLDIGGRIILKLISER
jgi:hypothetical protein